jgi:hypothetical protein
MTQPFRYPSSTNFMPVSTAYIIGYVRRVEDFPMNRYIQLVQAPAPAFFYTQLDRDQSLRIRNIDEFLFADGADRPQTKANQFGFREQQCFTVRYDFATSIGNQALQQAEKQWNAKQVYLQGLASQAMLARTINLWQGSPSAAGAGAWLGLDTVSMWPSTNTSDANTLNGGAGTWATASDDPTNANYLAIRKSLLAAVQTIFAQTNGRVKWEDLRLVVSPTLARTMISTPELYNYIRQTEWAVDKIEKDGKNLNARFGLPPELYGLEVVVEDTPYLNDLPVASQTVGSTSRSFVKADNKAVIMSRPGKLDSQVGPSFSTVQVYWYEHQMQVFEYNDPINLKTQMHVTDQYVPVLPAGESGYLITGCI